MRKIREVLRLHFEHGRSKREIARVINVSPHRLQPRGPGQAGRPVLAVATRLRRRLPEALAVPAQRAVVGAAVGARWADFAQRTGAQRRDAGTSVAGVQGRATGRLRVQRTLRALPTLAPATDDVDAAIPHYGRAPVPQEGNYHWASCFPRRALRASITIASTKPTIRARGLVLLSHT